MALAKTLIAIALLALLAAATARDLAADNAEPEAQHGAAATALDLIHRKLLGVDKKGHGGKYYGGKHHGYKHHKYYYPAYHHGYKYYDHKYYYYDYDHCHKGYYVCFDDDYKECGCHGYYKYKWYRC